MDEEIIGDQDIKDGERRVWMRELNKPNPETPLPYKGMDIRTEIASRVFGDIFNRYVGTYTQESMDTEFVAKKTLKYTDALINQLNKKE